jgi:hypothetical protein
MTNVLKIIVH